MLEALKFLNEEQGHERRTEEVYVEYPSDLDPVVIDTERVEPQLRQEHEVSEIQENVQKYEP